MATIDEIFDAMADEAAEAGHEYLIIDPETRTITVPESERIFGVTGDELADRKYFMCPRYVGDGLDLAGMFLRVNYRNAGGEEDGYLVKDVEAHGEYITFSWQLWPKVCLYEGSIQFGVCADLPNTTDRKMPDWNTTMASGEVLEGLHSDSGDVEAETSDVVTQLRAETAAQTAAVEATGAAQVTKVQTEGTSQVNTVKVTGAQTEADALATIKAQGEATLASIPAEYKDLANQVDKLTRDRAAAIVCQAEGEQLQITDASNDPLQGLRIFGKTEQVKTTGAQLIPHPYFNGNKTYNGITWNIHDDGSVDARGTATANSPLYFTNSAHDLEPGQYTISGSAPGVAVRVDSTNRETGAWTTGVAISKNGAPVTFTITAEDAVKYTYTVYASVESGSTASATIYPMLNAGAVALPWEPYSGGVASPSPAWPQELQNLPAPVVGVYGKNLIMSYVDTTKLHNGVTFTVNNDGSITMDGTATEAALFNMVTLYELGPVIRPGAKYTISGATKVAAIQVYEWQGTWVQRASTSSETTFTLTENAQGVLIRYVINPNLTADNLTVYPMLRLASDADSTYEQGKAAQIVTITTPGSLPGIPVASGGNYTDAAGQEWVCDEVDLARGVYVQRVGQIVFDGGQSYHINAYQQGFGYYVFGCTNAGASYSEAPMLADKLNFKPWGYFTVDDIGDYICYEAYSFYISLADQSIQTVEAFQEYLAANPITAQYILAEPVETALTDAELQAYLAIHSNKPTTTVLNDAGTHMVLEYAADPKTYIDNKLAALIAANN